MMDMVWLSLDVRVRPRMTDGTLGRLPRGCCLRAMRNSGSNVLRGDCSLIRSRCIGSKGIDDQLQMTLKIRDQAPRAEVRRNAHSGLVATWKLLRLMLSGGNFMLLNQQQASFLVAVEGVHRIEETFSLDEPRPESPIDVKDEYGILRFQVSADRRMVAGTGSENALSAEIDDVSPRRIV
jgi:hypothetical protein